MKIVFVSSVFLGLVMLMVVAMTLFNINQAQLILANQSDLQTEVENLKYRSESMAYNLGELVNINFPPQSPTENLNIENSENASDPGTNGSVSNTDNMNKVEEVKNIQSKENLAAIFSKAPVVELGNLEGLPSVGRAAMAVYENNTYHKIAAVNMPKISGGQYFKAWLIDDSATGNAIVTGKMNYEASSSNATLLFVGEGDLSKYRKVLVTLESVDANGQNISYDVLAGRFDDTVDFRVSPGDMSQAPMAVPQNGAISADKPDIESLIKSLQGGGDLSSLLSGANIGDSLGNASLEDLLKKLKK